MKYEVGDRVRIKGLDWYTENKDRINEVACGNTFFIPEMAKYCEKIVTISFVLPVVGVYHIKEDGGMFNWTDDMIEGLVEEEMSLDKAGQITDFEYEGLAYSLPDGYIFKDQDGNVINATKIVLEKKKKEYPKTYEECYQITGLSKTSDIYGYKNGLLFEFQKLLIARDAYWKVAGEEMGLGKPWKPDWNAKDNHFYTIHTFNGKIECSATAHRNAVLIFPTAEMRDAFYENFKNEIEICKELL